MASDPSTHLANRWQFSWEPWPDHGQVEVSDTTSGVYGLIHKETGRIYVGSSTEINRRRRHHLFHLKANKHCNPYLQHAWNKYGEEAFKWVILAAVTDISVLRREEQKWIDRFRCFEDSRGFNRSPSATDSIGWRKGRPLSAIHKARIGRSNKGNKSRTGMTISDRHREILRATQLGNKHCLGRIASEETRKKLSESNRGKPAHPELNPNTILNPHSAREILALFALGETVQSIGRKFGIKGSHVYDVACHRSWPSVRLSDDMEQMILKRRQACLINYNSPEVINVLTLAASGVSSPHISRKTGISLTRVRNIIRRRTWKNLSIPRELRDQLESRCNRYWPNGHRPCGSQACP